LTSKTEAGQAHAKGNIVVADASRNKLRRMLPYA